MNKKKESYASPQIVCIEVNVERGFAESDKGGGNIPDMSEEEIY